MITSNTDGNLALDGVDLVEVAAQFQTPLYVYGAQSIRYAYRRLRDSLPDEVRVHFSVKANPSLAVCHVLREAGAHAEIASAGELELATAAGWPAEHILFAGPGKTDAELRSAVRAGIGGLHVESIGELQRLSNIAADEGRIQAVCLRVNLDQSPSTDARIVTGGGAQKFGIDAAQCGPAIEAVRAAHSLRMDGFHFFAGSQFSDHTALLRMMDAYMAQARVLCQEHGVRPRLIDLGGGIGVTHWDNEAAFDIEALGTGITARVRSWNKEACFEQTRFALEPGRALVSAAGVYLSSVLDVKESCGQSFVILDGGIHHALLPITSNGYRVVVANRMLQENSKQVSSLGGPLCTSADQWYSGAQLPQASVGDIVAVLNSGAYGLSASMTLFLSHGTPAEILLDAEEAHLIRTRSTPQDLLHNQALPKASR